MSGYQSHTVAEGEDIVSIAELYGLAPGDIWNDPKNAEIKERVRDPYVLRDGDVLAIPPPPEPQGRPIATGKRHTFRRKGIPEKLILYFHVDDEPRAGVPYVLEIVEENKRYEGATDGEGKLEHWVQPSSRKAKLSLFDPEKEEPEVYALRLGALEPVEEDAGLRARLKNLGFLQDEEADTRELSRAIEAFQEQYELKETGKVNEATQVMLVKVHRS